MQTKLSKAGTRKWNWLEQAARPGAALPEEASLRALHEARRSMLRKLSNYFAKEHRAN